MKTNEIIKHIVDLNFQLARTQRFLYVLLNNDLESSNTIREKLKEIEEAALVEVQKKFPDLGVQRNQEETQQN